GGTRRRNAGPIYRLKKADADRVEEELVALRRANNDQVSTLESLLLENMTAMKQEMSSLERSRVNGLAARIEALDRIARSSPAILWAHWFILLLFIAVETAPVFVKLISP